MVHKGVTTQWVGTAIDALQHPRRWNIWLLTRSQNSLALPPPYGAAAAGEARVDSVGINTRSQRSTFPPSREPASAAHWKLLPRLHKEVRVVVGGWERAHGDTESQGYCVTLGWRKSDLELRLRALVSEAAPYESLREMWKNSSWFSQFRSVSAAQCDRSLHRPPCGDTPLPLQCHMSMLDLSSLTIFSEFHFLLWMCFTFILPFLKDFSQLKFSINCFTKENEFLYEWS